MHVPETRSGAQLCAEWSELQSFEVHGRLFSLLHRHPTPAYTLGLTLGVEGAGFVARGLHHPRAHLAVVNPVASHLVTHVLDAHAAADAPVLLANANLKDARRGIRNQSSKHLSHQQV